MPRTPSPSASSVGLRKPSNRTTNLSNQPSIGQIEPLAGTLLGAQGSLLARLDGPQIIVQHCAHLSMATEESLVVLGLDATDRLIWQGCWPGTRDAVRVPPRELVQAAWAHGALAMVIVHNHPSGLLVASLQDLEFTLAVQMIAGEMAVDLVDHLILARGGWLSMRRASLLRSTRGTRGRPW